MFRHITRRKADPHHLTGITAATGRRKIVTATIEETEEVVHKEMEDARGREILHPNRKVSSLVVVAIKGTPIFFRTMPNK